MEITPVKSLDELRQLPVGAVVEIKHPEKTLAVKIREIHPLTERGTNFIYQAYGNAVGNLNCLFWWSRVHF